MSKRDVVYVCVWSGDVKPALDRAASRYPGSEIREFAHWKLRVSRFTERIRLLRGLQGRAFIFCFQSLDQFRHRPIVEYFHLLHRCQETVLCDATARWESIRAVDVVRSTPRVLLRVLLDEKTLVFWWCYVRMLLVGLKPVETSAVGNRLEMVYLIPSLASMGSSGGAISHIRGFLSALKDTGKTCRVFAAKPLAQTAFENELIDVPNEPYFFWEAAALSFNFAFASGVQARLAEASPRYLYQRHCRFSVAGALLSRRLSVPLILEYNGSEVWIADHWDPTFFRRLVRLCEEVTLRSAARIIVVSEALRAELLLRGFQEHRIRVNPNGVDPQYFYPGRGRVSGRRELAVKPDEVLVGFVGSFSLWHGIEVLQQAIIRLLSKGEPCQLRFILMGDGLLHGDIRSALALYEATGQVIFTGAISSNDVAKYLDAADILVSPHIPTPDGSRFFGSPTKLFEYMAAGKAIVASRLEQLAEVLEHDRTAWLTTPGNPEELANAVLILALDPIKRQALGAAARREAIEHHSWARNVAWALNETALARGDSIADEEELGQQAGSSARLP